MPEMTDAYQWQGRTMIGSDGEKIGKIIGDLRGPADRQARVGDGVTAACSAPSRTSCRWRAPHPTARTSGREVTKDQVKDAPGVEDDGELSEQEEQRCLSTTTCPTRRRGQRPLRARPTAASSDADEPTASTVGHDTSGPTTDDAMTRSEEELRVGTRQREAGRARLRKYVVTEMVTKTVPVSHEEVRIEREPITDANRDQATSGADISEEEHEVVLHEDEPVVEKDVVAKERVRLGTETVTEDREVSEEVRKEQIEAEGATEHDARPLSPRVECSRRPGRAQPQHAVRHDTEQKQPSMRIDAPARPAALRA